MNNRTLRDIIESRLQEILKYLKTNCNNTYSKAMSPYTNFVNTLSPDDQVNLELIQRTWNAAIQVACDRARAEKQGQSLDGAEAINAAICAINCVLEP